MPKIARDAKKYEEVKTAELIPYARNAKSHDAAHVRAIAASIATFGFNDPVEIDENGVILAGHGRVLAAEYLGRETVPCLRLRHMDDNRKRGYRLANNRLTETSEWQHEILKEELEAIDFEQFEIGEEEMGFGGAFWEGEDSYRDGLGAGVREVSEEDVERAEAEKGGYARAERGGVEAVCPHCGETFTISV